MVDSWKEEGEEEEEEQGGGGRGGGKGEMVIYCFVCLHAAGVVSGDTKSCGFWTAILRRCCVTVKRMGNSFRGIVG